MLTNRSHGCLSGKDYCTYHYEIKIHFQGAITVAQKHEGILEGSEMAFASDCLQHLSFLLCHISDATCLFTSDCL